MRSEHTGLFERNIPENREELYSHGDFGVPNNLASVIEAARIRAWEVADGPKNEICIPRRTLTEAQEQEKLNDLCKRDLLEDPRVKAALANPKQRDERERVIDSCRILGKLIAARDLLVVAELLVRTRRKIDLSLKVAAGDREALREWRDVRKRRELLAAATLDTWHRRNLGLVPSEDQVIRTLHLYKVALKVADKQRSRRKAASMSDAERVELVKELRELTEILSSQQGQIVLLDQKITLTAYEPKARTGGKMRNKNAETNKDSQDNAKKKKIAFYKIYEETSGPRRTQKTIKEFRKRFDAEDMRPEDRMKAPGRRTAQTWLAEMKNRLPHAP
jgi:hypothetical protein